MEEDRFRWTNVGDAYVKALDKLLTPLRLVGKATDAEWQDLGRPV
jgi:hypothetical protein